VAHLYPNIDNQLVKEGVPHLTEKGKGQEEKKQKARGKKAKGKGQKARGKGQECKR